VSVVQPNPTSVFTFMTAISKSKRIDLGLSVMSALAEPGPHSCEEIAAWAGCCPQAVQVILSKALTKLRRALKRERFDKAELQDD
jgi:hypothetical protein